MRAKEPKVPYEKSFRAKSRRHGKSFGNYVEGILIYLKILFSQVKMMQALQVYKLASSEWRNPIFGFCIIFGLQHQQSSSQLEGPSAYINLPSNYDLRPRRHCST